MSPAPSIRQQVDIADVLKQLADVQAGVIRLTNGMSAEQFNWRPAPERWSIGQCIEHLALAAVCDAKSLQSAIVEGRAQGLRGDGPFRYGPISTWLVKIVEPPAKIKVSAVAKLQPAERMDRVATVDRFRARHEEVAMIVQDAAGLDLAAIKAGLPFGPFQVALGMRMRLVTAHARRHIHQAWQVRKNSLFPA